MKTAYAKEPAMTLAESIAFWIFIVMTVGFFAWVAYLAYKD